MNNDGKFYELNILLGILLILISLFLVSGANYSSPTTGNIYECGNITTPGNYSLNQSFSAVQSGYGHACILISAHNVSIDGRGFTIKGSNTSIPNGIKSWNFENITLMNLNLTNFSYEVNFTNSRNVTFHEYNISTYYFQNLTDSYFLRPIYGLFRFQKQINTTGLTLSNDITFNNNSLFYNKTQFPVTSNITFYNLANLGSYPYSMFDGSTCGVSCINTTPLTDSTVKLNVVQGGTYKIQSNFSQYNITLNYGWNFFAIANPNDLELRQFNLSIGGRFYLFGVSASNNLSLNNLNYKNKSETELSTWYDSAKNKNIFYPIGVYNNTGINQGYKWIDLNDSTYLTASKSHWIRTNITGNISFSAYGSSLTFSYPILNITFYNGSVEYNSTQSYYNGWIGSESDTATSYIQYWNSPLTRFESLEETQNVQAWEGYIMWSRLNNLTMVIKV